MSYFGFETATLSPHGLWATSLDYLLDFLQKNQFNLVRLPFSAKFAETMDTAHPSAIRFDLNPKLGGKTTGQVMDAVIEGCRRRGIYVLLDMHTLNPGEPIPPLWYRNGFSEARVVAAWKKIITRYKNSSAVFAIDIKNEPHDPATWGGPFPTDWPAAAERIGNQLLAINPRLLVFVEGIGATKDGVPTWWGGSLDRALEHPVRLHIPNRLVLSPHVYGPSIYAQPYFTDPAFPRNMPAIWERQFGFLKGKGAPLIIGEWGGWYLPGTKDRVWQDAFAAWLIKKGLGCSTIYWALNPNSGDTGGLLQNDWRTPVADKLALLRRVCPNPTRATLP